MTEHARTLRALRGLETVIRRAVTESRAGYEFSANSHTFAAMSACFAAEHALDDLRAALAAEFPTTTT
jgi:hypothetical protein